MTVSRSCLEGREDGRPMGYRTLDRVIEELKTRGYVERFEGGSDPDDASIVYAIETRSGTKGLLVDAFGPYANPEVGRLLETVEIQGGAR